MSIPLIVAIPTALLGALGAVSEPASAVLAWLGLGVVAGGVTWAWTRFAPWPRQRHDRPAFGSPR